MPPPTALRASMAIRDDAELYRVLQASFRSGGQMI